MKTLAEIRSQTVVNFIDVPDNHEVPRNMVDTTGAIPFPELGWKWDGRDFSDQQLFSIEVDTTRIRANSVSEATVIVRSVNFDGSPDNSFSGQSGLGFEDDEGSNLTQRVTLASGVGTIGIQMEIPGRIDVSLVSKDIEVVRSSDTEGGFSIHGT